MNIENTEDTPDENAGARPLGFWLRTVDALISREFAAAFDGEGATRRDWMLLNAVSGDVDAPGFAERFARKGGKRLRGLEQCSVCGYRPRYLATGARSSLFSLGAYKGS